MAAGVGKVAKKARDLPWRCRLGAGREIEDDDAAGSRAQHGCRGDCGTTGGEDAGTREPGNRSEQHEPDDRRPPREARKIRRLREGDRRGRQRVPLNACSALPTNPVMASPTGGVSAQAIRVASSARSGEPERTSSRPRRSSAVRLRRGSSRADARRARTSARSAELSLSNPRRGRGIRRANGTRSAAAPRASTPTPTHSSRSRVDAPRRSLVAPSG